MSEVNELSFYVISRSGVKERVAFDKITERITTLCYGLDLDILDPALITKSVSQTIFPGVTTQELDNIASNVAASLSQIHPDYMLLAARIAISNLQKETKPTFSEAMDMLHNNVCTATGQNQPIISEKFHTIIKANQTKLNAAIVNSRDFRFDLDTFKKIKDHYLLRVNDAIVERPQYLFMRAAVGIHGEDIERVIDVYNLMSEGFFLPSPSTLYYACTDRPMFASYVIDMMADSIDGIYRTVGLCGMSAAMSAGVGLSVHKIRSAGSPIGSTGVSSGLSTMLTVYDATADYVKSSVSQWPTDITVYLEPWHPDIFEYLALGKIQGKNELRARHLSYALWIPDLFMKRVKDDEMWSLMCPYDCPGLDSVHGDDFEDLYIKYEAEKRFKKQVKAEHLWRVIVEMQMETGGPALVYKDKANERANQNNIGVIKSAGVHADVMQLTGDKIAPIITGTISLARFVNSKQFDFTRLKNVAKSVTYALDAIIDVSKHPVESNAPEKCHRPIAIGVCGFADALIELGYEFESHEAFELNRRVFETIYFGALEASCELAEKFGAYDGYEGSAVSRGQLQPDMRNIKPTDQWNWSELRSKIQKHGLRNSALTAGLAAEQESHLLNTSTACEPRKSFVKIGSVLNETYQIIDPRLVKALQTANLWNENMKKVIVAHGGRLQGLQTIPDKLKRVFVTSWEISNRTLIDMAADRAGYLDHSQSLNLFVDVPSYGTLTSIHFYAWGKGLKTGMRRLYANVGVKNGHNGVAEITKKMGGL